MKHIAKDSEILWIYSMGKRFQVRCITDSVDEANVYMERNTETALIACFGPFNIIANQYAGIKYSLASELDADEYDAEFRRAEQAVSDGN
jgi:hypothetical protein